MVPRPSRLRSVARYTAVALVAAAVSLLPITPIAGARAVDNGTIGIRPQFESDFFRVTLAPGSDVAATALVSNKSDVPVTLLNYPADAISTPQGSFALAERTDERTGVGAWVTLPAEEITVQPRSELAVPFRLSVPIGVTPGDYAGGIIIESPPVASTTSGGDVPFQFQVIQRQGVRIYLSVDGTATPALGDGLLTWQRSGSTITFTLPIENTGNITLHPTATLALSSWMGKDTTLSFTTPEILLPGARLDLVATLTDASILHIGNAEATLVSEVGSQTVRTSLVYAPWWVIVLAVLALLAGILGIWRTIASVRRTRRTLPGVSPPGGTRSPSVQPEDVSVASAVAPGPDRPFASG